MTGPASIMATEPPAAQSFAKTPPFLRAKLEGIVVELGRARPHVTTAIAMG
jgi:hypothetical protein